MGLKDAIKVSKYLCRKNPANSLIEARRENSAKLHVIAIQLIRNLSKYS